VERNGKFELDDEETSTADFPTLIEFANLLDLKLISHHEVVA